MARRVAARARMAAGGGGSGAPYSLSPLRVFPGQHAEDSIDAGFGAVCRGLDLNTAELTPQLVARIKDDVRRWRVLVFKAQGQVSGARQVEISTHLGELDRTGFRKHSRQPHPDVFRVSNDQREGWTGVGVLGWHVDGTFLDRPYKYQTMHFHSVVDGGDTHFVPLGELYRRQPAAVRERWERLWLLTGDGLAHPLVYVHPIRGDATMLFHCGRPFCAGWAEDDNAADTAKRRPARAVAAAAVQDEIAAAADAALDHIGVRMRWEAGDFAINDNAGNAHFACPGTQADPGRVGLRILHRTTIAGEVVPTKPDGRTSFHLSR